MDKQLNDAMVWMNGKMNQQNGQDLTLEPVVRVAEIQAKTKVKRERLEKKKSPIAHRGFPTELYGNRLQRQS